MAEIEMQEDALIEILARLPVKSLIRFTCVCKYWLSLIGSSEFATKHYATRLSYLSENHHECDSLLSVFQPASSISIFSYQDLTFQTAFKVRPAVVYDPPRFGIHHRDIFSDCRVLGPCNGLFLIQLLRAVTRVLLLLWNPATREVFRLPSLNDCYCCSGFGFDHVTNDYKVVCFHGNMACSRVVYLYSLATNSWRQLDAALNEIDSSKHMYCPFLSASSNARMYHWILIDIGRYETTYSLLSFDMVDEVFVQTPLPTDATRSCDIHGFLYQGSNHLYPTLCSMEKSSEQGTTRGMHIWALKGYGPTGLWNKQQCIRLPQVLNFGLHMVLWKNKAIVSGDGDTMTSYNFTTQEIKSLQIPAEGDIIGYTESLVSIAKFVRQQPLANADHPSGGLLQDLHQEAMTFFYVPPGVQHEDDQEDSAIETIFQQLLLQGELIPQNDEEDDDDSSTDSAFLRPEGTSFVEYGLIDTDTDPKLEPLRKIEWQKLYKLPYCLRELNQPMISNPCTF